MIEGGLRMKFGRLEILHEVSLKALGLLFFYNTNTLGINETKNFCTSYDRKHLKPCTHPDVSVLMTSVTPSIYNSS